MKRFLIEQRGVYYLTTGKLLRYDPEAADSPGQRDGVEHVKREFKRIHDLPHTWYKAVEISDDRFSAVNTGEAS